MANSFSTIQHIARLALPHLIDNLVFPNLIHRDLSTEYNLERGATIRVRKPVVYEAQEFDPDAGVMTQELNEGTVDVTLDKIASVDIEVGALESATSFDSLERLFVKPAAEAIAQKINADGLGLYKDVAASVGTAGTTPSTLEDLASVRLALNTARVPVSPRRAVWDPSADAAFTTLPALVNAEKSGATTALREGSIGRVFGMDNYMSQAVRTHETAITQATGLTTTGSTAAGATKVSIKGSALAGKFVAGDLLLIGGRSYTVVSDSATASSNAIASVEISPAVDKTLADGTAVEFMGAHTANLAFHPNAFAFVSRPLVAPAGVESYTTSYNGVSLRVVRGYDMIFKREMLSMDVLYGYKTIYPELAVRCLG